MTDAIRSATSDALKLKAIEDGFKKWLELDLSQSSDSETGYELADSAGSLGSDSNGLFLQSTLNILTKDTKSDAWKIQQIRLSHSLNFGPHGKL